MKYSLDHTIRKNDLDSGAGVTGLLVLLAVVFIVGAVGYYTFGQVVPPGFMGVRQTSTGPTQGFSESGLRPGLRFTVPFVTKIHLVPETIQVLNFHRSEPTDIASRASGEDAGKGLEIRSSDGVAVDVDVSILSRFYQAPGEGHGGPSDLFTKVGTTEVDWDNQIRRVAADELRQALGALLARQFYEEPAKRQSALDLARNRMQGRLAPFGIEAITVLLRRYTYSDDRIDAAIFNKNLQEQEQRLKDAEGKLAEVKANLEQVAAEIDARIETLKVKGDNEAQVTRSEAALFENQKKAEGDLLVAKAMAEVDKLRASALAQSSGSQIYVARQLAPLLSSLKGGIVSNVDPYDIDSWSKRLGVDNSKPVPARTVVSPRTFTPTTPEVAKPLLRTTPLAEPTVAPTVGAQ